MKNILIAILFFGILRCMEKKMFSTRIDSGLLKLAKKLAIDLERPLNDLLEEALKDLLKKHEKKSSSK